MLRALRLLLAAWLFTLSASAPAAATATQDLLLMGRPGGAIAGASVDLNFARGQYWLKGAAGPIVNSRASAAWALDSGGNLHACAAFQNCVTDLGVASFEQRTNGIRNNTMVGAGAGVNPNFWNIGGSATGLTITATGVSTINGMSAITYSVSGTPTGSGTVLFQMEANSIVTASYGQTWTYSVFVMGSNNTNLGASTGLEIFQTSPVGLTGFNQNSSLPATFTKQTFSATLNNSATAFIIPYYQLVVTSGNPVNLTVTFAAPQLELNPNLPASVASATVAGGGAAYVGASGTMTYSGPGCTTNPVLNVTTSAGAINAVTSVATAGVCPAANGLPAAGSTSWTPGGGLSVGTGASFNLVPTDNSSKAFAHPPILTAGSAVTVNQDKISVATQPCANPSLLAIGTPSDPSGNQNFSAILTNVSDTPSTILYRANNLSYFTAGGSFPGPNTSWPVGTQGKSASSVNGTAYKTVFNNGTPGTGTNTALGALNLLGIGNDPVFGGDSFNGYEREVALACGTSLTSASNDVPANDNGPRFAALGDVLAPEEARAARSRTFGAAA